MENFSVRELTFLSGKCHTSLVVSGVQMEHEIVSVRNGSDF